MQVGSVWLVTLAVGVVVALVGLVVSPEAIVPLGAAIALLAAAGWYRSSRGPRRQPAPSLPPAAPRVSDRADLSSRGRFIGWATIGLGGLVAAFVAAPVAGLSVLEAFRRRDERPVDLGPAGAFPEGRFVVATFLSDPRQGEVSRRTAYVRNNGLVGRQPSFTILSSRCTHVGCPTQPEGVQLGRRRARRTATGPVDLAPTAWVVGFGCPCHGSQFDQEGNRTAGPAARALDRYRFSVIGGHLWLGPRYSVSRVDGAGGQARIHAFPLLDPGEPVTGPERLLYSLQPRR